MGIFFRHNISSYALVILMLFLILSKHSVQRDAPITTEPLTSRKRPPTNIETASSDNKRSKVIRPTPRKTNRICMPDIEFDCSSETSQSEIAIITKVVVSTNKSEEKASVMRTPVPSVEKRGPPVLSANEELVKKVHTQCILRLQYLLYCF